MRTTREQSDERLLVSDTFERGDAGAPRAPAAPEGFWDEPGQRVPIHHRCDVLVVGGGPSGTAAAVAAAREGASVTLLERYNHLGGLATGGLVIWIDRMTDWQGQLVIRGLAEEFIGRLPPEAVAGPPREDWGSADAARAAHWAQRTAAFHGIVTWSPTVDPERLKLLGQEMVLESGARLVYHAWAARPIVEEAGGARAVTGVVFESKQGRLAIMASVVVDATGDGDLFARAGAAFDNDIEAADIHHAMNTAWLFGGVDMRRWIAFRRGEPEAFAAFMQRGREACGLFDKPFVAWRDDIALFMGPRQTGWSALDVEEQTQVEVRSHRAMAEHLAFYRAHAPGFERAYLLLSAPQLGVRHARRLKGVDAVLRRRWPEGRALADEVGITPAVSPKFPNISIPYGALVPLQLDGLLACGRHISCDAHSHGFMREIPQCWITGQAAGVAAALAVAQGVPPRALPVPQLQAALRRQGVHLRATGDDSIGAAAASPGTAGAALAPPQAVATAGAAHGPR